MKIPDYPRLIDDHVLQCAAGIVRVVKETAGYEGNLHHREIRGRNVIDAAFVLLAWRHRLAFDYKANGVVVTADRNHAVGRNAQNAR